MTRRRSGPSAPQTLIRGAARALFPFTAVFTGALAVTSVTACNEGGTETGNPSFEAKLSYTAYSNDAAVATVRTPNTSGGAVVRAVWLGLGEVTFARTCDAAAKDDPHAPAIGVGNHASGAHVFADFTLRPGEYCAVDLPFVRGGDVTLPAEAPAAIKDHSVVLEGDAPDGTPFVVVSTPAEPVVDLTAARSGQSIAIRATSPAMLMTFDVAAWLRGVDFSSATATGGTIEISSTSNPALLRTFEANFARGVQLYVDDDADGVLDDSPDLLAAAAR